MEMAPRGKFSFVTMFESRVGDWESKLKGFKLQGKLKRDAVNMLKVIVYRVTLTCTVKRENLAEVNFH